VGYLFGCAGVKDSKVWTLLMLCFEANCFLRLKFYETELDLDFECLKIVQLMHVLTQGSNLVVIVCIMN